MFMAKKEYIEELFKTFKAEKNFDRNITFQQVLSLAELVKKIPENVQDVLDVTFKGDKSKDYYQGMIAAYFHSHCMVMDPNCDPPQDSIYFVMLMVAYKMIEDNIMEEYIH